MYITRVVEYKQKPKRDYRSRTEEISDRTSVQPFNPATEHQEQYGSDGYKEVDRCSNSRLINALENIGSSVTLKI